MQKLITKTNTKKTDNIKSNIQNLNEKLTIEDILKFYDKTSDNKSLIGLEYERLSLSDFGFHNAKYTDVEKIIVNFSEISDWELVFDGSCVIGAKSKNGSTISLEPGCQLEISLRPYENILDIDIEFNEIINLLDKIAKVYNITFLGYGINPVDNCDEIELLNKKRYQIMYSYLPYHRKGELSVKMMKKTAGIQVNIDYQNETDVYYKLKFLNLIMPFMTALSSNSPFENSKMTQYKSNRANVWRFTGENRCNLFYKNIFKKIIFKKSLFKNYVNELLSLPMIFIERNNEAIPICGKINFEQFMFEGYLNYSATIDDFILHQSLCFPDVRLKKYIEIRNHDSSTPAFALALCAFYKGLMKTDIKKLLNMVSYIKIDKVDYYNEIILQNGLDFNINDKITGWDVVVQLLNVARKNLNSKERTYLAPIIDIIKFKKTSADLIIDSNITTAADLVEFLTT